ncbi:HNH endonuclease [Neorhizobium sp. LjRoot104]|uniref:HNH endonuclease n=1 Tax=Neorhizobium sp. LjRoot104 TaxID=3342254 RepID=UPI003ECD9994
MTTWLDDLIAVYNELGGEGSYKEVYPLAQRRRLARGASWTPKAEASIRRTVEDHAKSSSNFRGKEVFYSVQGHGRGIWGLMPTFLTSATSIVQVEVRYREGIEGIAAEATYLRRLRDPSLVEARKLRDDFTCQACGFRLDVGGGRFIIDVHHVHPLGKASSSVLTTIDDLICLCPTCHRIAHTGKLEPLGLNEVRLISRPKTFSRSKSDSSR